MTTRILICASTFPRYQGDGMVDFVWQQARYLKKHYPDFDVHVLVPHAPEASQYEVWEGVHIHRYKYFKPESFQTLVYPAIWPNIKEKPLRLFQVPFLLAACYFATRRIVQQYKIDLIYSHWFTPQGLMCNRVANQFSIPHTLTSHAADITILRKIPFLGNYLVRKILPQFKAISFAGSRGRNQALDFFDSNTRDEIEVKSTVLPMGVDLNLPDCSADENQQVNDGKLRLVFVGRLAEKKGVTYLLHAMADVLNKGIPVQLDLLGDGPLLGDIKQQVNALNLSNSVKFHGFVNGQDKFRVLSQADLFVLPSIVTADGDAEGLPVSLLEAMSAGMLCCASDESGAPDIIEDGKTAILFKAKSSEALANVIQQVSLMDNTSRAAIANNAKAAGIEFLWDNMIHKHAAYLITPFIGLDRRDQ
ncbi:glycosyltransferase family 4 protein [Aliiglaciecola sp. LCG003]|uniref:glycosyltransferase family 4 protein n=1 Tax=Aliiglaciecola sp. LCG003 TaxID=3053655 RepID=UPI0025742B0F|nr:glycosyltransferase family 4 protein [Aliiglaciecola sp. LCG003]WJG10465.1 glycosyltransferase family 4 protein [Aliiglaciecola sp. LCG003]